MEYLSSQVAGTYLATIKVPPSKPIVICVFKGSDFDVANRFDLAKEGLPHTLLCFCCKLSVAQSNVYSRLEGWIKGLDTVRGQEQDSLEVL